MPTYVFFCVQCGEFEQWRSIHAGALEACPMCGNTVAKVITPPALHGIGVRGSETRRVDSTERQWSKDMGSYERLRMEGHQPRKITGAHKLETTAISDWEIRTGQRHKDDVVNNAMERAQDMIRHGGSDA